HLRVTELVAGHQVGEGPSVGANTFADRTRQRLVGVRGATEANVLHEGHIEVLGLPGERSKQVGTGDGWNRDAALPAAQAAATVAIGARGLGTADLATPLPVSGERLPVGQAATAVDRLAVG